MSLKLRIRFLFAIVGLALCSGPAFALTNYVTSGSFENSGYNDWTFCCTVKEDPAYYAGTPRHPDGRTHLGIATFLSQDVQTVIGREYLLQFFATAIPRVRFGEFDVQTFTTSPRNFLGFYKISCTVTGQTTLTHLEFDVADTAFEIDDIRLNWLFEPLRIVEQPHSLTAVESANAVLRVNADGGPPIAYQWEFNSASIDGATNSSLVISNVQSANVGDYRVLVSSPTDSIISQTAHLSIEPLPQAPVILSQPAGDTFLAGYGVSLGAVALGAPPLEYQWSLNGNALPGQTNSILSFSAIDSTNEGSYQVLVRNKTASVLSLAANVSVTNPITAGGGYINVANRAVNAPVYDADGITLLSSTNFVEQTYVGASPTVLRPLGPLGRFRTNLFVAGFFVLPNVIKVPDVVPGGVAYVQARVWDSSFGATYEEARARGGKYGSSPTAIAKTSDSQITLPLPVPFQPFALTAGLPEFATGRLQAGSKHGQEPITWNLIGSPGLTYLVEHKLPPQNWVPLLVLTNITGTVSFTDPGEENSSIRFYRARLLD